ncbi:MAG: TatD family hydrolase [Corallococcus sp.]|nr:TatD family hydrolase [Corallococcus sp.]
MIDTHAHLDDERLMPFADNIISDGRKENLKIVINNSCNLNSMQTGVNLAEKYDEVYCTVGMHPHDAKDFDDKFVELMIHYADLPKTVAVGEIGLDYYYDLSERQIQRDVFARQLEIADKLKLPVTLHIRNAYGDALDILQAQKRYLNSGVVWHCYSGSAEIARQMAKLGHYFAFGGAITFKNANKEDVIKSVPLELLLTETDSPYMTPVPMRGQTNYPCYVKYIAQKLAEVYGLHTDEIHRAVEDNCKRLFTKIDFDKIDNCNIQ